MPMPRTVCGIGRKERSCFGGTRYDWSYVTSTIPWWTASKQRPKLPRYQRGSGTYRNDLMFFLLGQLHIYPLTAYMRPISHFAFINDSEVYFHIGLFVLCQLGIIIAATYPSLKAQEGPCTTIRIRRDIGFLSGVKRSHHTVQITPH